MDVSDRRKSFRILVTLAIPVIIEQILTTLLQYVDTAMVGRLGPAATASVSLTTSVNWLIGNVFSAIGIAVVAMVASAYGANDHEKIRRVSSQAVNYILISGLAVTAIAVGLSPFTFHPHLDAGRCLHTGPGLKVFSHHFIADSLSRIVHHLCKRAQSGQGHKDSDGREPRGECSERDS